MRRKIEEAVPAERERERETTVVAGGRNDSQEGTARTGE